MSRAKIGCGIMALLGLVLGAMVIFKPPELPVDAKQSLDDYARKYEGEGFAFSLVSYEKAARTMGGEVNNIEFIPGGVSWPAGICPPNGPMVLDNWCATVDRPIQISIGGKATHFILQRQGQLWFAEGIPDRDARLFRQFGCGRW